MTTLAYSPWGTGYPNCFPFGKLFDRTQDGTKSMQNIDAFVLWGGEDIPSSYYNAKPHPMNQNRGISVRDDWEWKALKYCLARDIPIIGVCRGAQMLCAFAGGKLIQHVNNHGSTHGVITSDGEAFSVTSCHHQMLDIEGLSAELLAWSTQRSDMFHGETRETPEHLKKVVAAQEFKEPEVVYFPEVKGLAIQGHPEWARDDSRFVEYCNEQVSRLLLNKEPA